MALVKRNIKRSSTTLSRKQNFYAYLFILPAFIFLFMFLFMPLATAVVKSFYRYDCMSINEFIGLENYRKLFFEDPKFWDSMLRLLIYFVGFLICLFTQIVTSKLVQSVANQRLQKVFRATFIVPMVVPAIVTLLMWKFIYYPEIGVIARIAEMFGVSSPNLLGDPRTVNVSLIFIGFPWVAGTNFIILYSAFQGVDKSLTEAAAIDGSIGINTFFKIELPTILPQLKVLFVYGIIGLVQQYEKNLVMTNGGPNNASNLPGLHMYNVALGSLEPEFGYACAISVLLFAVTMGASVMAMRFKEEKNA
ncbi:MAG: sugar ABC transporter permease [Clostridia bacterium]|nr:sugar ABC transporter permease [Clostridia bacterium]